MLKLLILCDAAPTLRQVAAEWRAGTGGAIELWCPADADVAGAAQAAAEMAADLKQQPAGSLAARAWVAACLSIAAGDAPVLILEDAGLSVAILRAAGAALASHEMVLVPAPSGSVALIGLRRAVPELFAGAPAGLPAPSLRARARSRGLGYRELPALAST